MAAPITTLGSQIRGRMIPLHDRSAFDEATLKGGGGTGECDLLSGTGPDMSGTGCRVSGLFRARTREARNAETGRSRPGGSGPRRGALAAHGRHVVRYPSWERGALPRRSPRRP